LRGISIFDENLLYKNPIPSEYDQIVDHITGAKASSQVPIVKKNPLISLEKIFSQVQNIYDNVNASIVHHP
jgi:hypothetical protein